MTLPSDLSPYVTQAIKKARVEIRRYQALLLSPPENVTPDELDFWQGEIDRYTLAIDELAASFLIG